MGQSKNEYARRRRLARENRPNFLAILDEVTQVVSIHHNLQLGDETAVVMHRDQTVVLNITDAYKTAKADVRCGPFSLPTSTVTPGGEPLDTARALLIPIEVALADPLLIIPLPDDEPLLLIDGNHRLYKMIQSGVESFHAYVLPPERLLWVISERRHVSECAPEVLQNLTPEEELHRVMEAMTRHRDLGV